jgi:hypothetical protein
MDNCTIDIGLNYIPIKYNPESHESHESYESHEKINGNYDYILFFEKF